MADLLGADLELADIHKLYECHERWLEHKRDLFTHLTSRWKDLFNARFEVLLYDLTSTYFDRSGSRLQKDLSLRPIYHQLEHRIEAHIFISFPACGLHVTLRRRLRDLAPGLTPRSVLEKFATIPMLGVPLPTTDERTVILSRYTQPETDVQLLLQRLKLELPGQPPPKITAPKASGESGSVVKT
jgi:hypothetical protein